MVLPWPSQSKIKMLLNFKQTLHYAKIPPRTIHFLQWRRQKGSKRQSCCCLLCPCSGALAKRFRICHLGAFLESTKKCNTFRETPARRCSPCCSAVPLFFPEPHAPSSSARGSVLHLPLATLHRASQPGLLSAWDTCSPLKMLWHNDTSHPGKTRHAKYLLT